MYYSSVTPENLSLPQVYFGGGLVANVNADLLGFVMIREWIIV